MRHLQPIMEELMNRQKPLTWGSRDHREEMRGMEKKKVKWKWIVLIGAVTAAVFLGGRMIYHRFFSPYMGSVFTWAVIKDKEWEDSSGEKERAYFLTLEDISGQEICLRLRMGGELEKQRLVYEALIVGEEYGIDFFYEIPRKIAEQNGLIIREGAVPEDLEEQGFVMVGTEVMIHADMLMKNSELAEKYVEIRNVSSIEVQ